MLSRLFCSQKSKALSTLSQKTATVAVFGDKLSQNGDYSRMATIVASVDTL